MDRGPRRRPLPASSGHGRVQTQANCGVWLTARHRGHRDTHATTDPQETLGRHLPGAPTTCHTGDTLSTGRKHTSGCTGHSEHRSSSVPPIPALCGGYAVNERHRGGCESHTLSTERKALWVAPAGVAKVQICMSHVTHAYGQTPNSPLNLLYMCTCCDIHVPVTSSPPLFRVRGALRPLGAPRPPCGDPPSWGPNRPVKGSALVIVLVTPMQPA